MFTHSSTYITPPMALHPEDAKKFKIFLAGSIEMGKAEDWQSELINSTMNKPYTDEVVFMNPRRPDWDSSQEQVITNPYFKEQVEWELNMLDTADLILMYFDPKTLSPISLLELGIYATTSNKMLVCCPDGYWRNGNVEIVCNRFHVPFYASKENWLHTVETLLNNLGTNVK